MPHQRVLIRLGTRTWLLYHRNQSGVSILTNVFEVSTLQVKVNNEITISLSSYPYHMIKIIMLPIYSTVKNRRN